MGSGRASVGVVPGGRGEVHDFFPTFVTKMLMAGKPGSRAMITAIMDHKTMSMLTCHDTTGEYDILRAVVGKTSKNLAQ